MQTATDLRTSQPEAAAPSVMPPVKRSKRGIFLAGATVLIAGGIAVVAMTSGSSAGLPSVKAGVSEYAVSLDHTTLAPGKYSFRIANNGKVEHELIAFRTTLAPDALPTGPDGRINEEDPALVPATDGPDIKAGQSATRTVDLTTKGTYIFMCNLPAHYGLGMHTVLTVS